MSKRYKGESFRLALGLWYSRQGLRLYHQSLSQLHLHFVFCMTGFFHKTNQTPPAVTFSFILLHKVFYFKNFNIAIFPGCQACIFFSSYIWKSAKVWIDTFALKSHLVCLFKLLKAFQLYHRGGSAYIHIWVHLNGIEVNLNDNIRHAASTS